MSEFIGAGIETDADDRARDNERLLSIIDAGIDRDLVQADYEAYKKSKPKYAIIGEGAYDRILFYQKHASQEALQAHDELVENNQNLAYFVANKASSSFKRLDRDDLSQEAWAMLSLAAWNYTPDSKVSFSGHVYHTVYNRIGLLVAHSEYALRLQPQHLQMAKNARAAGMNLMRTSNTDTSALQDMFGITDASHVSRIEASFRHVRSLDETHGRRISYFDHDGQPSTGTWNNISDGLLTNTHNEMEEEVIWAATYGPVVESLLEGLSERERRIIEMRFGFFDGDPYTLDQVGEAYGISRERVRQLEAKALQVLRTQVVIHGGSVEDIPVKKLADYGQFAEPLAVREHRADTRYEKKLATLRAHQDALHAIGDFEAEHKVKDPMSHAAARLLLVDDVTDQAFWKREGWLSDVNLDQYRLPDIRHDSVKRYLEHCITEITKAYEGQLPVPSDQWDPVVNQQKSEIAKQFIEQEISNNSDLRQAALRDRFVLYKSSETIVNDEELIEGQQSINNTDEMHGIEEIVHDKFYTTLHNYLEEMYGSHPEFKELLKEAINEIKGEFKDQELKDSDFKSYREAIEWYIVDRL